jgi:Bacterial Ig-like domain (group 3)
VQSSWASGVSIWRNRALLLFTLVFATTIAHAATIHVPADQKTIQAGINAANPGDTVLVAPGTYYENIDFKGKAITVTSSGGAATTIIDGGSTTGFATVAFITGETRASIISNMTIRNGGSAAQSAFPEVAGGIYAYKSAPTILNNIITANRCSGVTNDTAAALIQGNNISATIALTTDFCTLDHGNAILEFGYTASFGLNIVPTIAGNIIENNVQGIYGETGGIYLWGADGTIIQGNTIRNNNGTQAGAIASNNINLVSILQNLIYGNSGGDAGAINLAPPEDTTGPFIGIIAGNTIAGNTVTSSSVYPGNTPASQVFLQGNLAQYLLVNNIIVGNKAGTAALNCDVSYEYLAITPLVFDHNDIYAGPGSSYGGSCPDQTGSYGNINADPSFSNPTGNDYTLRSGSPAIDTGNNSAPQMTSTDFAGSPRIQDATGKGYPVVDMGVYEFSGLKNASPTTLLLTPSNYFDPDYTILHPNQPLTFTSTLLSAAGIPSGPVTIDVDGAAATTVLVGPSGTATFSLPTLTPGLHAFTSTYPGSGVFPPAVSVKFFLIIPPVATTLTLKSSLNPSIVGQNVTFTATTSATDGSVPTPITLTDTTANTVLATLTPNSAGVATFSTSTLTTGFHTITASYAGTVTYSAASATVNQQVLSGYSTTTIVTSSLNPANYGQSVTFNATITGPSQTTGAPTGSVQFNDGTTLLGTQPLSVTPGDVS